MQSDTIHNVQGVLDLDKTDPKREEATKQIQEEIKQWVARYRRDNSVAGKPSFTCVPHTPKNYNMLLKIRCASGMPKEVASLGPVEYVRSLVIHA